MNTIGLFEIQSSNPSRDLVFYQEVFGWTFERDHSIPVEYYRITTETIRGGLLERPAKVPPMQHGTNAFTCSFQVANFDATAAKIMELGGQVALPKFAIPNVCWQGYFIDPDNNTFGIFEADENAK